MSPETTRTTVALPTQLLERIDEAVRAGRVRSRSDFLTRAIRNELAAAERAEVDAEFALMADDAEYQALSDQLVREFATAGLDTVAPTDATQ